MKAIGRVLALVLVLGMTLSANLGTDFARAQPLEAQQMAATTGGMSASWCALTAGFTVGCAVTGNALCALGGAVFYMISCESGG